MVTWMSGLVGKVWEYVVPKDGERPEPPPSDDDERARLVKEVDAAWWQWKTARTYFDNVTDPALIDHAIYEIEAAERKYMYLLRRAQQLGFDASGQVPAEAATDDPHSLPSP